MVFGLKNHYNYALSRPSETHSLLIFGNEQISLEVI